MKIFRYFLLFCICFFLQAFLKGSNLDKNKNDFIHGNELYKKGNFSEAYKIYDQIHPKIKQVHFNLGNCAFKLGKHGYALLHWRRAELGWGLFGRQDLENNIQMIKRKIKKTEIKDSEENPFHGVVNFYELVISKFFSCIKAISFLSLQVLFLVTWLIFFMIQYYFDQRKKRKLVKKSIVVLCMFFALLLGIKYSFNYRKHAVILYPQVQLFSGPGNNFSLLGQLYESDEVIILKESSGFFKIMYENQLGWIDKKYIESLLP